MDVVRCKACVVWIETALTSNGGHVVSGGHHDDDAAKILTVVHVRITNCFVIWIFSGSTVGLSVEKKSEVKEGNIIYIWTHTLWLLGFFIFFCFSVGARDARTS